MKKQAIITFDYEVFLGRRTGTIGNCVLKPTSEALKILKKNNARAIFFVDTTWLLFLQKYFHDDFSLVAEQLREIIAAGSSVELHLHPQWLDAYADGGNIVFESFSHYKLHSLNQEEVTDLFRQSLDLLQSITGRKVTCFRAGGWCIEPFNQIKESFVTYGIKYDFSVVPGTFLNEGNVFDYDFTRVPDLPFYRFGDTVNELDENGSFTEFPLSTYRNSPVYRIKNKLLLRIRNDKMFGDGIGIKEKSASSKLRQLFSASRGMLTIDKTSNLFFRFLLGIHFRNSSLLIIVSHPKTMSPQALRNLATITRSYNTLNSSDLDLLT